MAIIEHEQEPSRLKRLHFGPRIPSKSKRRNETLGTAVGMGGRRGACVVQLQNFSENMDSNQLKHNPFNIACLSLIEINRPSIVFRHCVEKYTTSTMRRRCCFCLLLHSKIFHMKYETKTHINIRSTLSLMRCKFETRENEKRYPG